MAPTARVFKVRFDLEGFQDLLIDAPEGESGKWFKMLRQDGRSWSGGWRPPPVYSPEPLLRRPDFWHLVGCYGLVVDARALDTAEPYLLAAGELLPLPFGNELLHISNVTGVYDCIDTDSAERSATGTEITRYPFIEHRIPETTLFKIPETVATEMFCASFGERDPELDFKFVVEHHRLTGLRFEEVWNDDVGPIAQDSNPFLAW